MKRPRTEPEDTEAKWTPIGDVFALDPTKIIYNGTLEIQKEDQHDGETAHGTKLHDAHIFGIREEDRILFFCPMGQTDRFTCFKIDPAHTVGGRVSAAENLQPHQYKVQMDKRLLTLESTKIEYKSVPECWSDCPKSYKYFEGIGRVDYVPWTFAKDIPVHYFVRKQYLVCVVFSLTHEEYKGWLTYAALLKERIINGNLKPPREVAS